MSGNPAMAERAHLSIGEVLALLQDDFPDVTISKIRFLESQGLLDPERTPSGYRKFYEADIERLRWILRQQRDNFLPLRVIKDRLEEVGPRGAPADDLPLALPPAAAAPAPQPAAAAPPSRPPVPVEPETDRTARRPGPSTLPASPSIFESLQARAADEAPAAPEPHVPPMPERPAQRAGSAHLDAGPTSVSLTTDELATASGCDTKVVAELVRYGLIAGRPMGRETVFDEEALIVARLAGAFSRYGVEARHLRMYKVAAEREAGFLEQVVLPLMKQRNPSARRQAVENLHELTGLGDALRGALLRQALRGYTG